jgi:hypothetical protein
VPARVGQSGSCKPFNLASLTVVNGSRIVQERTIWETIRLQGSELLDKLKQVIHEGNARKVVIKQGDNVVAEFPLTAGVVGTLISPVLAAIGALVALLKDCTIEVERAVPGNKPPQSATQNQD